jgi:hypothetical protein
LTPTEKAVVFPGEKMGSASSGSSKSNLKKGVKSSKE